MAKKGVDYIWPQSKRGIVSRRESRGAAGRRWPRILTIKQRGHATSYATASVRNIPDCAVAAMTSVPCNPSFDGLHSGMIRSFKSKKLRRFFEADDAADIYALIASKALNRRIARLYKLPLAGRIASQRVLAHDRVARTCGGKRSDLCASIVFDLLIGFILVFALLVVFVLAGVDDRLVVVQFRLPLVFARGRLRNRQPACN